MRTRSLFTLLPLLALAMGQSFSIIQPGKGGKAKSKAEDPKKDEECEGEEEDDTEEDDVAPPTDEEDDPSEGDDAPPEEDDDEEEDPKAKAATKKQSKIARALNVAWGKADPLATANDTLRASNATLTKQLAAARTAKKQTEALLTEAGKQHTALTTILADKLGLKGDITPAALTAALDSTIQKETARDIAKAGVPVRKLPKANADESTGYPTNGTTAEQVAWVRKNRAAKAAAKANARR